jgi:hypothetical protein
MGTDEDKLIGAFKKMKTFDEFCSTKNSYLRIYQSDMLDDIDGDVDEDEIWKQLSRTVRSLYEKPRTKPVSSVGGGGPKPTTFGVRNQTTGGGGREPYQIMVGDNWKDLTIGSTGPDVSALQRELGLPLEKNPIFGPKTKSAVMEYQKKNRLPVTGVVDSKMFIAIMSAVKPSEIVKERDLTRLVKRVMNEDKDNKKMDLKSDLRNIINDEYSEIEPSDLVEVLEELLHYAKNDVFRSKKPNKGYITKDEVKKNFKKNYN